MEDFIIFLLYMKKLGFWEFKKFAQSQPAWIWQCKEREWENLVSKYLALISTLLSLREPSSEP